MKTLFKCAENLEMVMVLLAYSININMQHLKTKKKPQKIQMTVYKDYLI